MSKNSWGRERQAAPVSTIAVQCEEYCSSKSTPQTATRNTSNT
eukprot:CAMPEP_0173394954 /NCGR_PEP_ID=MMETSP1356-20130122/30268_1 /TAXON_ID=77927 ORGANISM="Hemiselmis virescens, Strain PCC157" /NCGR_SAMPLE_ID=MMETSP1356 /ASSEMBLY_ACC=CAM_ASM_000847 /LENGTH=42 /DNA_ID= /DNA_START= /DNA_END= /DNA_ORIENTATION=